MTPEHYDNEKLKQLRGGRSLRTVATEISTFLGREIHFNKVARAERGEGVTYDFLCDLARFYNVERDELLYAVQTAA